LGPGYRLPNILVPMAAAAVVALLLIQRRIVPALALAVLGATGLLVFLVSVHVNGLPSDRYLYPLAVFLVAIIAIGLSLLASGSPRPYARIALAASVVAISLGYMLTFRTENAASSGPDFVAQVEAMRCGAENRIEMRISPEAWGMWVPCQSG
jgi:hypothetical protein